VGEADLQTLGKRLAAWHVKDRFQVPALPASREDLEPVFLTFHRNIIPTRLLAILDVVCSQKAIK